MRGGHAVLCLLAFALMFRLVVPAGWMPMAGSGYAITLCTGAGAVSAWVDKDGVVQRDGPAPAQKGDSHCAFAGFNETLTTPDGLCILPPALAYARRLAGSPFSVVMVGRGLAAPPPPPTGPPVSL